MMTSEYTKFKITGGNPVQVRPLPFMRNVCGDRLNFLYAMVKKEDYQMNQFEIDYWKKIHETNANQPKKTNFQRPAHISLFLSEFLKNRGNNK